jgi:hypothetical protein
VSFKEDKSGTSGTLTIKSGKQEVDLTLLGQYVTADFKVANDGAGGIVVTDPPINSATSQSRQLLEVERLDDGAVISSLASASASAVPAGSSLARPRLRFGAWRATWAPFDRVAARQQRMS